jgi:hypothetical protein
VNQKCELCQQNPVGMEFNTPTPAGMFSAGICFPCWAKYPDDRSVVTAILRIRKPLAADQFGLDPGVFSHVENIPPEILPEVMFFILTGKRLQDATKEQEP